MKKIVIFIYLLLYLVTVTGFSYTVHYCGGEVSSVLFHTPTSDKCICGSNKMKKNCCKDKTVSIKIEDGQVNTQNCLITFKNLLNLQIDLPQSFCFEYSHFPILVLEDYFHHPPDVEKHPLYILNKVFRI